MAMDFDFILEKMGKLGRSQILVIISVYYYALPAAFVSYSLIFTHYAPEFRCRIPSWENCTFKKFSDSIEAISPACDSDLGCNGCKRYNFTASECSCNDTFCVNASTQAIINCQHGYTFDASVLSNTLVTQFNLVCNHVVLQAASPSLRYVGSFFGAIVFGYISDRFGRKPCMVLATITTVLTHVVYSFSSSYTMYVAFRTVNAFFRVGCYGNFFLYVMEIVGKEYRTPVGMGMNVVYTFGYMILSGLAYYWKDWQQLEKVIIVATIPSVIFALMLPESPRWLFSNGKLKRPQKICNIMSRINQRSITSKDWEEGKRLGEKIELEIKAKGLSERKYSVLDLFRKPGIRMITIISIYLWFTNCLVYFGISFNTGTLSGNIFVNNALGGVVELAAYAVCILITDKFGRKKLLSITLGISGISLLLNAVLKEYSTGNQAMETASQVFAFIGKFGISGSFGVIYNYTSELFPTVVRSNAMYITDCAAGVGGILFPFVILSQETVRWLPNVILGVVAALASILSFRLPETTNIELLETLEEANLFYKGKISVVHQKRRQMSSSNNKTKVAPLDETFEGKIDKENVTSI